MSSGTINVTASELDRATTAFGAAMSTISDFYAENVRGTMSAADFDNLGRNLLLGNAATAMSLELLEGAVGGDVWGSVPTAIGAGLGTALAAVLVTGMGIAGAPALLIGVPLGVLLGWAGSQIGQWISDNWSSFAGVQQIEELAERFAERIGEFVDNLMNSLSDLLDDLRDFPDWLPSLTDIFNPRPIDPLVIDLDGDGIELTALNRSSAFFDLDGDGFRERTGWVNPDDGLLALDRDGNGRIEGIAELFGSPTTSGYEELRALDSNRDGRITSQDAQFSALRIWRDLDGDGVSDAGELMSLGQAGITSISLASSAARQWINGNEVVRTAQVTFNDGRTTTSGDVLFNMSQAESVFAKSAGFQYDVDVFLLPSLRGFGEVADLRVSMSMDGALKVQAENLIATARAGNFAAFKSGFDGFLAKWAGVEDVIWAQDATQLSAAFAFRESDWNRYLQNEALGVQFNPPPAIRGYVIYDTKGSVSERELTAWMEANDYVVPGFTSPSMIGDPGISLSVVIRGMGLSAAGPSLVLRRGSINPFQEGESAPEMDASAFAFLQRIMGQDFSAGVNFVSSEDIIVSNPTPAQISQLKDAYEDVQSYMMARFLAQAAWSVIAQEGEAADLSHLAPFKNIFLNPLTDSIAGDQSAFVYDLIGMYRSTGIGTDADALGVLAMFAKDMPELAGVVLSVIPDVEPSLVTAAFEISNLVRASSADDTLQVVGNALVVGLEGNDFISGDAGRQTIFGGTGNDNLNGGEGSDTYVYSRGDGNDTITDYDFWRGADRLVFTDANVADIVASRAPGNDLVLTFANGETITLDRQLDEDRRHGIETFQFADGSTLSEAQMRNKMVADMKVTGQVTGTENDETYFHTRGDGSYTITDYDFWRGADRLVFTDTRSTDVLVQRRQSDPNDVVLTLDVGDQITLLDQLVNNNRQGVERIDFSDGVQWTRTNLQSAPIVDDSLIYG